MKNKYAKYRLLLQPPSERIKIQFCVHSIFTILQEIQKVNI